MTTCLRWSALGVAAVLPLGVAGCSDIPLSGGPSASYPKEAGPLTLPPPAVLKGTSG